MLVVGVIAVTLAFTVGVFIIQNMFNQPITITNNSLYEKAEIQVDKLENIKYESNYNSNSLDIYYPKDSNEQLPVLFWVHGGGFVEVIMKV